MDFMTYAMYMLGGADPEALLEISTLERTAEKTFQTFFQHYVSTNVSMEKGSWVYQAINSSLPSDLGEVISLQLGPGGNSTEIKASDYQDNLHPVSSTNRTAIATISTRIEVLQMQPTAVWLSLAILTWLIATLVILAAGQRTYLKGLKNNVECIADVLTLVAGSERLLQLVRERGIEGLKDEDLTMTRLGWFQDVRGEWQWGIEVVKPDSKSDREAGRRLELQREV